MAPLSARRCIPRVPGNLREERAAMPSASRPIPAQPRLVERPQLAAQVGTTSFGWSRSKIRVAGFVLLAVAVPAAAGFALPVPSVQWLCLGWLACVAFLAHGLSRRACQDSVVLRVDQHGILDRRLMPRHIKWQEIEAICPVDTERNHTVDIRLHWPKSTLGETRLSVRIGAFCQLGYGIPAVTISLLLLDGSVSEMVEAIAQHRPDLLHPTNRPAPLAAH
jgi:hypothetical protein